MSASHNQKHDGRHHRGDQTPDGVVATTIPRTAQITNQAVLVSGRLSVVRIWLEKGDIVRGIAFYSGTTLAGTPTNQWFALYSQARALLGITADDTTTAWAANTRKALNLTSPYTVTASGYFYLGLMVAAATPPTMLGQTSQSTVLNRPPIVQGADGTNTGLTVPAGAPNPAAAFSASGSIMYVEVI